MKNTRTKTCLKWLAVCFRLILLTSWGALGLLLPNQSWAQSNPADFIDANSVGYLRIDIQEFDHAKTVAVAKKLLTSCPSVQDQLSQAEFFLETLTDQLRQLGASEFYWFHSLTDLFVGSPTFLVTVEDNQAKQQIAELARNLLSGFSDFDIRIINSGVAVGPAMMLDRHARRRLPIRADADKLLALHNDSPCCLVTSLGEDHRRVLRELFQAVSFPFDMFSGPMLADGANTVVVCVDPTLDRFIEISVSGQDEKQHLAFRQSVIRLLSSEETGHSDFVRGIARSFPFNEILFLPDFTIEKVDLSDLAASFNVESGAGRVVISLNQRDGSLDRFCKASESLAMFFDKRRMTSERSYSLRQCLLACHNYHDVYKSLPPFASRNGQGQPLLSWRVAILPYVREGELYNKFRLDEPWDSPHNKALIVEMPDFFATDPQLAKLGKTTIVMPIGPGTIGREKAYRLSNINDGSSNSALLIDVAPDEAEFWTQPTGWRFDPANPLRGLTVDGQTKLRVGMADGTVELLDVDPQKIRTVVRVDDQNVQGKKPPK